MDNLPYRRIFADRLASRLFIGLATLTMLFLLPACGRSRENHSSQQLLLRDQQQRLHHATQLQHISHTLLQRAELIVEGHAQDHSLDLLILSSGGYWGAFGAGFMAAWSERSSDRMPEFDLVSGISTGAYIAPFTLGLQADHPRWIEDLYRHGAHRWLSQPLHGMWPRRSSLYNHEGLVNTTAKIFTTQLIEQLAGLAAQHRQLLIATADLDLGRQVLWPLQQLSDDGMSSERLQQIMLASVAVPGLLPPQEIDDTMHVDGATVETMQVGTDPWVLEHLVASWQIKHPKTPLPPIRIYVIVNGKERIERETTQPRWPDIARRAISAAGKSGLHNGIRTLSLSAELLSLRYGIDCQVRWLAVPEDFHLPEDIDGFNPELTKLLADLGNDLGSAESIPWNTLAPTTIDLDGDHSLLPLRSNLDQGDPDQQQSKAFSPDLHSKPNTMP